MKRVNFLSFLESDHSSFFTCFDGFFTKFVYTYLVKYLGGDLASTWVTKLKGHVEDVAHLVNNAANVIVAKRNLKAANDANGAMVAAA